MKPTNSNTLKPANCGSHNPALFWLIVFLLFQAAAKAQENVQNGQPAPARQTTQKPAQPTQPTKPANKSTTSRVVTPVKHEVSELPQVGNKIASPFRHVLPGGKSKTATGSGQPAAQTTPAASHSAQRPNVGKQPATSASLGAQPAGFKLPPNARSVPQPGGGAHVVHPDGRQWVLDKNNQLKTFSRPGLQANYNDGRLSTVRVMRPSGSILVTHSSNGDRQAVGTHAGGVAVVTYGKGQGYVQRPIPGRLGYFKRSSVVDGRPVAHVYRAYGYKGGVYFRYVTPNYYQPKFYSWAQNPWPAAVAYDWARRPAPWLGMYADYFTPAPAYPTPVLWLTDFVMGANLKVAYQGHQEFASNQPGSAPPSAASTEATPLSPEVKDQLSQEVQAQVAQEQASASTATQPAPANPQAPPPELNPNLRTLVVSQNVDLGSPPCTLTPGDVIERTGDNLEAGNKVNVKVLSSKAGDCAAQTSGQVDLGTLQEMCNQFQEQVDAGLGTLASNEGQRGLPPGPSAGTRPLPEGNAQPDPDVVANLAQQQTEADAAEKAASEGQSAVASM